MPIFILKINLIKLTIIKVTVADEKTLCSPLRCPSGIVQIIMKEVSFLAIV